MASAISYEFYQSKLGAANGLATLDGAGTIPVSQLPASAIETYKGEYADEVALVAAYPTALLADYAYINDTSSYWYWNAGLVVPAWVNQQITEIDYLALTVAAQVAVPYIIL